MLELIGNWYYFIVMLAWMAAVFVIPGIFFALVLIKLLRWLYDRYNWLRWFSL
jgi:hypothetical protein